jgi:hypothetical protein
MAYTRRTACRSTGRPPVGQLAPQNMPPPQESQPDTPQHASQEEEPFVIELVIPESPMAQGSPAEEQQQPKDHDIEDKANEEYPPPSDTDDEKMYRYADEVESFGAEAPVLIARLWALLEHQGITTAPRYRIKEVPCPGQVELKANAEIFFRFGVLCRHKRPAFRASHSDVVADAAWQAITLWVRSNKSQLQNSVQHLLPYKYPQDGDGAPLGWDSGAEHSSTGHSVRARVSPHPAVELQRHHPRVPEDGRGSSQ